ncbi:MAG: diguanylate cyclase [Sedimenticola sp.]
MTENNTSSGNNEGISREFAEEVERFESLVTNVPAIIYRCALDKDWTMEYISEFTEELTGYPASDFLQRARSFASIIHPEDRDHVERVVDKSVHSDGRYIIEYRIVDNQGVTHWVFEKGQVIHTRTGDVDFLDGFIIDISERKRVEEMLQDKKELVEAIQNLQSRFIVQPDPVEISLGLLADVRKLTGSEYGLVGEVYTTPEGRPYLTIYALSKLAWNSESRALYETAKEKGFEFHKLDNLFGHVITDEEVVISNDPRNDKRSTGLPKGHPPINNFLGIPVFYGEKLVGEIGLANREDGYDQEVLDYIKPLVIAYGQIIVARQAQQAREAAEQALSKLATLDGLLGIPNRRSFDEYLAKQWKQAQRDKKPLSLIMIDIDHFKLYNDRYGHRQGDECLIQVSRLIEKCLHRPSDLAARYGGEEFCCVLPDTPLEGAVDVAEAIRSIVIEEAIPHASSPVAAHVTLSLGVATLVPSSEKSPNDLILFADQVLYKAKSEGRNRVISKGH